MNDSMTDQPSNRPIERGKFGTDARTPPTQECLMHLQFFVVSLFVFSTRNFHPHPSNKMCDDVIAFATKLTPTTYTVNNLKLKNSHGRTWSTQMRVH